MKRKNLKLRSNQIFFGESQSDHLFICCNGGFKNLRKHSRRYIKSAHSNFGQNEKGVLNVEGTALHFPHRRSETLSSCNSKDKCNRLSQCDSKSSVFRPRCIQIRSLHTSFSQKTPPLPIKQIEFVINSVKVDRISMGKENYCFNFEKKNIEKSGESGESKKGLKLKRIRPQTSQPQLGLRKDFFLTCK